MYLAAFVLLALLTGGLFYENLIWRLIILPAADSAQSGIQADYFERPHLKGKSYRREFIPQAQLKVSRPDSSVLGAGVLRLRKPSSLQFLLECDDFGNLSIDGRKVIDQAKKQSARNTSQAVVQLDAGPHLLLLEVDNLAGAGWLALKTRSGPDEKYVFAAKDLNIHPVKLSNFSVWWTTRSTVRIILIAALALLLICFAYFFRGWSPLARFYAAIRRGDAWLCSQDHLFRKFWLKNSIFWFSAALLIILICMKIWFRPYYILLVSEDFIVEYLQSFLYFIIAILSLINAVKLIKQRLVMQGVACCILFLGFMFVSLEEISWGQRIFDFKIPEFFAQHNLQREITFHNLDIVGRGLFDMYILAGFYGSFAWVFASLIKIRRIHLVSLCVPDWFISFYFFICFLIYTIDTYFKPLGSILNIEWQDLETAELFLSLGFTSFVVVSYIRLGRLCRRLALIRKSHFHKAAHPAN